MNTENYTEFIVDLERYQPDKVVDDLNYYAIDLPPHWCSIQAGRIHLVCVETEVNRAWLRYPAGSKGVLSVNFKGNRLIFLQDSGSEKTDWSQVELLIPSTVENILLWDGGQLTVSGRLNHLRELDLFGKCTADLSEARVDLDKPFHLNLSDNSRCRLGAISCPFLEIDAGDTASVQIASLSAENLRVHALGKAHVSLAGQADLVHVRSGEQGVIVADRLTVVTGKVVAEDESHITGPFQSCNCHEADAGRIELVPSKVLTTQLPTEELPKDAKEFRLLQMDVVISVLRHLIPEPGGLHSVGCMWIGTRYDHAARQVLKCDLAQLMQIENQHLALLGEGSGCFVDLDRVRDAKSHLWDCISQHFGYQMLYAVHLDDSQVDWEKLPYDSAMYHSAPIYWMR